MLPFWPRRREIPRKPAGAREARFDCASRPGDRYGRSPGKNKASGRSAPFLRQGRQNDVWRRGEKATHEIPCTTGKCKFPTSHEGFVAPASGRRFWWKIACGKGAGETPFGLAQGKPALHKPASSG